MMRSWDPLKLAIIAALVLAAVSRILWARTGIQWLISASDVFFSLFLLAPAFLAILGGDALLQWPRMMGRFGRCIASDFPWRELPAANKLCICLLAGASTAFGLLVLYEGLSLLAEAFL